LSSIDRLELSEQERPRRQKKKLFGRYEKTGRRESWPRRRVVSIDKREGGACVGGRKINPHVRVFMIYSRRPRSVNQKDSLCRFEGKRIYL